MRFFNDDADVAATLAVIIWIVIGLLITGILKMIGLPVYIPY